MSVPRFDLGPHQMTPSSEGAYVRYEDYAKLEKALEQATVGLTIGKVDELDGEDYIGHKPVILVAKVADALELAAYLKAKEQPQ